MTNEELITKIKAEIERRIAYLRQSRDVRWGTKIEENERLLSFLSTLESEKPMNQEELEEEINRTYHDGSVADTSDLDHNSYENIARHFYDIGCRRTAEKYDEIEYNRQRAEESVPNDLEEAAKVYFENPENSWQVTDVFIAGAKWQAEQLLKSSPLPEDTVLFNKGVEEGKRLMMEEAVEGLFQNTPFPTICLDDCKDYNFKDNQKVRIIIVKEN